MEVIVRLKPTEHEWTITKGQTGQEVDSKFEPKFHILTTAPYTLPMNLESPPEKLKPFWQDISGLLEISLMGQLFKSVDFNKGNVGLPLSQPLPDSRHAFSRQWPVPRLTI